MEKKIVVPKEMQVAFVKAMQDRFGSVPGGTAVGLEAALRWLSEHPIVPTMEQATEMSDSGHPCVLDGVWYAIEWQLRMFLAPEPKAPEEIKDLLFSEERKGLPDPYVNEYTARVDARIIEAYRRGQKNPV
jgi:hypothetical protein